MEEGSPELKSPQKGTESGDKSKADKEGKVDKPKRHRTLFTKEQTRILEEAFQESSKLNKRRCADLVDKTGVERSFSICIWFNNRRVKQRKQLVLQKEKEDRNGESPEKKPDISRNDGKNAEVSTSPADSKETKSSQPRKPKLLKFRYPRGPRKKNRTPPRMMPLPKIPDSPCRGPPDITLPLSELKFMLTCNLCKDYLYNATTLTECLHSFCKSCLLNYVTRNLHCPTCKMLIHPSNPYLNIRIDHTVQDIVHKILPEVEKKEKRKERDFYVSRGLPYPPKTIQAPTPPPVEPVESDEESDASGETDESEPEDIIPPNWTSVLLQYAGASEGLGTFKPLEKNFLRVPSDVTVGQIRRLLKMKLQLTCRTDIELHVFVDTTLVHDSLTLDEIKELFFTQEEDELLIMQYGILSAERNLFEELSNSNPDDFSDEYFEGATEENYIYKDDVDNCDYDFLTKGVEPNVDFPVVKREVIKEEIDDMHLYPGNCV